MSYILDALRRSEQERQQAEPLVLNPTSSETIELPRRRMGLLGAIAAVGVVAIASATYWIATSHEVGVVPAFGVSRIEVSPKLAASPEKDRADQARTEIKVAPPAPELKPSPFAAGLPQPSVRDLAKEARVETRSAVSPSPTPAVEVPSTPKQNRPQPAVATSPATTASEPIKFLRAMPEEFQRDLRDLSVTIHIYAPNEADRILYINNRQYHAGEQVREGVVVEEIVPDGVVLTHHGQRFKLPRPS